MSAKKKPKKKSKKSVKKTAGKKITKKKVTKKKPAAKKKPTTSKKAVTRAKTTAVAKSTTMNMPGPGDVAPDFSLPASHGGQVTLSSFRGSQNVILYFYPKDDTPGCTTEACSFRDHHGRIKATGTAIIGVSPDSVRSHDRFAGKYNLPFTLAADEQNDVARKYGVWVEKNMYGRTYMGIQRATFLIDKNGQVASVWPKVKVDGHTDEVLSAIARL
jgi:peroxiredoxin Q/BCP